MNTANNNQSGFSIVEGVIAIVVIGLLGFIGWTVYNTYTSKPAKVTSQTSSPNNGTTQPASNNNQPAQTVDPNAGYFVIKEWGVRFKSVNGLSNIEYTLKNNGSNADFTTQQLAAIESRCDPRQNSNFSGIGDVFRISTAEDQPPNAPTTSPLFLTSINGYNYFYGGTQAICADATTNPTAAKLFSTENPQLYTSLKTLEAAKTQGIFLDIKELGIKLPLSDGIKDLVYTYDNKYGINYLDFSTNSIIAADPTCNTSSSPLGTYTVYTAEQPNPGGADNQAGTLKAHVNGYFIYYHPVQYACGNSTASPLVSAAIPSLLTAVQGAQAQ